MRKNRNFNLFILVTSVFLALILLLSPTNIFDTNAAEYTQDLDLSSTQRKSLALDLIPTTATPSRSTLATVSSIEVVLLIRGSHDSVVSGHFEDGSGLQSVPFSQKQGQVSIPLRLPLSSFTLRLQDGWTASSYDVCANADPVYIELFPPRSLSFHFEQDGLSLSMAHVFLSSFESEVSIRGLTDQAGNATFPGISPSPLHVFLAHPDVLAKWSFPDGFGVSNRVVSLPIGDTFPHEVFTVADSVTHDPISMAHIEWSGQSIESFSSDSLGLLRFPPRTKNIDLIELSADGYGKQLVPLDDGGPTLYLQPEVDLTVQVVESQGLRQATGATVAAFLRTPNGMVHLSTKEADSKGHCRFSFHDGDDVALLAWRSHSGMATHELIVSRPMSEVRILLLKQKPLLIHLNGETAIGDLQVTTDSMITEDVEWRQLDESTVLVPFPSLLDKLTVRATGRGYAELRKRKDWLAPEALFVDFASNRFSGAVELEMIPTCSVRGSIQDQQGRFVPFALLQFRAIPLRQQLDNLTLHPSLFGDVPTSHPAWVLSSAYRAFETCSGLDGKYQIDSIPVGDYLTEFSRPGNVNMGIPFGLKAIHSYVYLPVNGELLLTLPSIYLLDLEIYDAATKRPIKHASLEITETSFEQSGDVMRHDFSGFRQHKWVSCDSVAKLRVSAAGYESKAVIHPGRLSAKQTLFLKPVAPARLRLGSEFAFAEIVVHFYRLLPQKSLRDYIAEAVVRLDSSGAADIFPPIDPCLLTLDSREPSAAKVTSAQYEYSEGYLIELQAQ